MSSEDSFGHRNRHTAQTAHRSLPIDETLRGGRAKGEAVVRFTVHSDGNGILDPEKVSAIGAFALASRSLGHAHVYVPLAESVSSAQHDRLSKELGRYIGVRVLGFKCFCRRGATRS